MKRTAFVLALLALPALAQEHAMHQHPDTAMAADTRTAVDFPPELRLSTLTHMRDHLLALQEIQVELSKSEYDRAADIAEERLGMSSMQLHGAHEVARYMPPGMQQAGNAMHRAASRFALAARDAGATGDVRPALAALGDVMAGCAACHASYRFK